MGRQWCDDGGGVAAATSPGAVSGDDLADGSMPDDAWLAALFAEGEALFGERDRQRAPGASVELERWPVEALSGAPGAELAWVVEGYTGPGAAAEAGSALLGGLSDDLLGELAGACARLQSWAAGVQALVVGERAAREASPLAHNSLVGQ
ncbi:HNH endonuclease, partial [Promicromonospora sp. NPDC060204]